MKNEPNLNRINFTRKNIDALPSPEKRYTQYYDTRTPALILRVYPSGVKTFYLYRRVDGRPEYISLGKYPALYPEQARRQAAKLNAEIGAGKNPAAEQRNIRSEMTLGDLFERYLNNHAKQYKLTWRYDENMFRLYFSHWAERCISTIERREVQALHGRIGAESGEYQANRAFAMLRTVF